MRTKTSILTIIPTIIGSFYFLIAPALRAQNKQAPKPGNAEQRAARFMDSVRKQPSLLLAFLRNMPKGGDLHNHLGGAIYAESLIDYASADGMCVDRTTSQLVPGPCQACEGYSPKPAASCAYHDQVLYNSIVDAWSMRNWNRGGEESGHDHFFASFGKFSAAMDHHYGEAIAEVAARAASDHLQYVELMHTADGMQSAGLGRNNGWNDNFGTLREQLLAGGLSGIVGKTRAQLDADETRMRSVLKCGTPDADAGCQVTVRYLYQVLRGLPREQVFAQILLGFELAKADPRFVGFNLVMPEDWYTPMHDFSLHMKIIAYLREVYPGVHLTLHAGELAMGLVPPEGLRFHIRDSVEKAHAERIGHGVAVMQESDPIELLKEMAQRNVLVEICLTSNDSILGVKGMQHPLPAYLKYGVPVALATDDEGVSRGNLTQEYQRAAETYSLAYADLKHMARASLEHSFLAGKSLWADGKSFRKLAACAADRPETEKISPACQKFLDANERARVQWTLEQASAEFEKQF